jgi:hypothetical protein
MSQPSPTEWFDTFPPLKEGVVWPEDAQMCPRHWAPCPNLSYNGIGLVTELMQVWLKELAPKGSYSRKTRNRQLAAAGHLCCTLGDDRMYQLWTHWVPAETVSVS